jgi:Set1/Ash2 histone methyltransferase complex subunit ASH2
VLVVYKNTTYYEEVGADKFDATTLKPVSHSKVVAYKNGVSQGTMFEDIFGGTYYPSVSVYMGAKVKLNFGPDFKYPPKDIEYKPVSDMVRCSVFVISFCSRSAIDFHDFTPIR